MQSSEHIHAFEEALARTLNYPFFSDPSVFVPGEIKTFPEDFVVTEIPLYEPAGEGDHLYFGVEKRKMTTNGAVVRIADALGVHSRALGVAGQKDASAVTRQTVSVEHVAPERIEALDIPGIRILWTKRHRNKLKMGHLLGNRFEIRLRNTAVERIESIRELLKWLEVNGVPNYFGQQRFGSRGDNWLVGRALLQNDYKTALEIVLGRPTPEIEGDEVSTARRLFSNGDIEASANAWPRGFGDNAKLCRTFLKTDGHYKKTMMSRGKKALTFYVSAYQSVLFNHVLAARLNTNTITQMREGDIAWKHDKGVCFSVEDASVETARAQQGEISPSGPLFGKKMKFPTGHAGQVEQELLTSEHVTLESFSRAGVFKSAGGRRPLRIFPQDCEVDADSDAHGDFLQFRFSLPAGAYATVLLREICKKEF